MPCSYELCYDPILEIGQPLPANLWDQSSLEYSTFALYINFVGPQEDETQSIDEIVADMRAGHSIIDRADSTGLVFLSRDETSSHVQTACNIASTCRKAGCEHCQTLALAVNLLVHDMCNMVNSAFRRHIQYNMQERGKHHSRRLQTWHPESS